MAAVYPDWCVNKESEITNTFGKLGGTVTVDGVGAARRVEVQDRLTRELFAATWSNLDGSWEVRQFPLGWTPAGYIAIFYDDTGTYNAEVADYIEPVEYTVTQ